MKVRLLVWSPAMYSLDVIVHKPSIINPRDCNSPLASCWSVTKGLLLSGSSTCHCTQLEAVTEQVSNACSPNGVRIGPGPGSTKISAEICQRVNLLKLIFSCSMFCMLCMQLSWQETHENIVCVGGGGGRNLVVTHRHCMLRVMWLLTHLLSHVYT